MHVRKAYLFWIAIAGVIGIGAFAALRPERVEVEWALVERGPLRVYAEAEAITRSKSRYVITAPVSGRAERMRLLAGDSVRPGTIIARIAPLPLDLLSMEQARSRLSAAQAHLAQARLALSQATRDVDRARAVEAAGGLSPQQRENAELAMQARTEDLRAANAEHHAAASAVRSNEPGAAAVVIRSPVRGQVLRVPEISERVTVAGSPLLEVGDASDLEIVADLLSTDAVRVQDGARVELEGWGGDSVLHARVRVVEPVATLHVSALGVDEQRVNVILDPVSTVPALGDGYRLTARIVLWEGRDVVSVPSSAVFREGNEWMVFVVEDGRARARALQVGHRSDSAVEVRSGVSVADTVVLFPSDRVRDGARMELR